MKKKLLLGALLLVAVGAKADPIDLQKAKDIASDYLIDTTEAMLVKRAGRDEAKARRLPAKTREAAPYYVFSRGEGQGFVIVSGDDCLPQVLGYTESGDFVENQMPPQLLSWLETMGAYVENLQTAGLNESLQSEARKAAYTATGVRKAATGRVKVDPLIQTHWHQSWPYFNRTPLYDGKNHSATGCVATAACQVLYYFHKDLPAELQGSTPTYDFGAPVTVSIPKGTPLKWELMLLHYNDSHPAEYDEVISTLMLAVGASAWMTYDASSGTHIENLVSPFSSLFNVSSKHKWLGHSELDQIAYANMLEKRPIVYAGYNEANEGHAIVLDGYRPSDDTYHFNFGWGGQGDGWYVLAEYYTKADNTTAVGVNGFGLNPCIVYDVKPKKLNVSAEIATPEGFIVSHQNKVEVTLKNNSTFPLEGVYFYLTTSYTTPSKLSDAKSSQVVTIPNDGSEVTVEFTANPTQERDYYIAITDEKLNVLARQQLTPTRSSYDLRLRGLQVLDNTLTENHGGHDFTVVNGTNVTVYADVFNNTDIGYQESPRLQILVSEDDGETFTELGNKLANHTSIDAHSAGEFRFDISNTASVPIEKGKLYAARLTDPLSLKTEAVMTYEEGAEMVYFLLSEEETEPLTATLEDNVLVFSGTWNAHSYETLTKNRGNAGAVAFDLSNVTGFNRVPTLQDKDYVQVLVGEGVEVTGKNIVNTFNNTADYLSLCVGYDFAIPSNIHAAKVELNLNATPGEWVLVTVPCNFTVPDGILAKQIDSHSSTGITNKTSIVTELEAGKTYLMMISSSSRQVLTATDVDVVAEPVENVDAALKGTFVNTTIPQEAFYLDNDYFRLAKESVDVAAFGGYFAPSDVKKDFRSTSNLSTDPIYVTMAKNIALAHETYDKYSSIVSDETCEDMQASIASCEHAFTTREYTNDEARDLNKMLQAKIEDFTRHISGEHLPAGYDVTSLIINPSFEEASSTGWKSATGNSVKKNSDVFYRGAGAHGDYILYSGQGNAIQQTIENIPEGVYTLTAKLGTYIDGAVTLFANDMESTVGASDYGIYYLRDAQIENIVIHEGETLTFGVNIVKPEDETPTEGVTNDTWYKADDFHLYYVRALTEEEKTPTGIVRVETHEGGNQGVIYDLSGRRVENASRGLYIIDGKKVLFK